MSQPSSSLAPAANLLNYKNFVSFRRSQELAWSEIKSLLAFYQQDAIHTAASSEAVIRYSSGSEVVMKENTYLIIGESGGGKDQSNIDRAVMREGKIEGQTSNEMWILTSSALVKLKAKEQSRKAKIKIEIKIKQPGSDSSSKKSKSLEIQLEEGQGQIVVASADKASGASPSRGAREVELKENKTVSIPFQEASENFGYKRESTDWLETVKVLLEAVQEEPSVTAKSLPKPTPTPTLVPEPTKSTPIAEEAPFLEIASPLNKAHTTGGSVVFAGRAGPAGSRLKINDKACELNAESQFSCSVPLDLGLNLFILQLTTSKGKTIFEKWIQTRTLR
jgi:hypothetical protein